VDGTWWLSGTTSEVEHEAYSTLLQLRDGRWRAVGVQAACPLPSQPDAHLDPPRRLGSALIVVGRCGEGDDAPDHQPMASVFASTDRGASWRRVPIPTGAASGRVVGVTSTGDELMVLVLRGTGDSPASGDRITIRAN
jgi:hypothetical protein